MARTPDIAGALEAIVARTVKVTLGPRLRRLEGQIRRLDRKVAKMGSRRRASAARRPRRRRAAVRSRGRRRSRR
jgi:hypothetical protein